MYDSLELLVKKKNMVQQTGKRIYKIQGLSIEKQEL